MRETAIALDHDDSLGEGPVWDAQTQRLIWVDIKRRRVQAWSPAAGVEVREFPDEVSLVAPTRDGRQVVAQVEKLCVTDGAGLVQLCTIDPDNRWTRLNDACCDEKGDLWVGTYSTRGEPDAAVYRIDRDGHAHQVLDGLVAANGMAWTPDGSGIWVTDTGRGRIDLYVPEGAERFLVPVRPLMEVDGTDGRPDGIALDLDGGVWVAMWGGAHVRRYDPDGTLTHTIPVPVTYPTSVAFGGPDLATLYITTSSHHLGDEAEVHAGSLLELSPDTPGLVTPVFNLE